MVLLVTSIFLIVNNHLRVFWGWISESAKLISYFMQQRAGIGVLNQHQNCHIELHHLIMKLGSFNLQNNVAYVPLGFLVSPSWSIADSLAFIRNDLISSRFNIIKPYVLGLQVNLECWNSSPSKNATCQEICYVSLVQLHTHTVTSAPFSSRLKDWKGKLMSAHYTETTSILHYFTHILSSDSILTLHMH